MSTNGFPGLATVELEARGAAWTAREIAQQPEVWIRVGDLVAREREALEAFLQPLVEIPRLRVVLTRWDLGIHRRLPCARAGRAAGPPRRGNCDHGLA